MFRISSYPMVVLMNQVGFNATALGNHEFDVNSLSPLMRFSNFSYICANIFPTEESGLHIVPTKVYDIDGLKVGVIGVIQVNAQGRPDTHPDNLKGIKFALPKNVLGQYEDFSHQCDATILLSHLGYQDDIEMAETYPWLDLIIGGHTHTQLTEDEPLHNGVLITQNKNKLPKVTRPPVDCSNISRASSLSLQQSIYSDSNPKASARRPSQRRCECTLESSDQNVRRYLALEGTSISIMCSTASEYPSPWPNEQIPQIRSAT